MLPENMYKINKIIQIKISLSYFTIILKNVRTI